MTDDPRDACRWARCRQDSTTIFLGVGLCDAHLERFWALVHEQAHYPEAGAFLRRWVGPRWRPFVRTSGEAPEA